MFLAIVKHNIRRYSMKMFMVSLVLLLAIVTYGQAQVGGSSGHAGATGEMMQGVPPGQTRQGQIGQGPMMQGMHQQGMGDMMEMCDGMMQMMREMMTIQQEMLANPTPAQKKQMSAQLSAMMKRMDAMKAQKGSMKGEMKGRMAPRVGGVPEGQVPSPQTGKDIHGH
jgi:hypothetical protein